MVFTPAPDPSADAGSPSDADVHVDAPELRWFIFVLFFIFGGITSLNDVIIPKLKELFTLNFTQAMLVQFCFFTAYLLIGIPGANLIKKIGYMRGAVVGLVTIMLGSLMFIPASQSASYPIFLFALFVLASGVVMVQVVANPLISLLGPAKTAHSRLTFGQAFNSLGTTIFPIVGSIIILGSLASVSASDLSGEALRAYRVQESQAIVNGYLGLAALVAVVAAAVWLFRNKLPVEKHEPGHMLGGFDLFKRPRFAFGALGIFLYVGAEVSIGSLIVSYLEQERVLGLDQESAGKLIGLYWGGAMVGRFIGSVLLRFISPGMVLAFCASMAVLLLGISTHTTGNLAGYSLLAIGLMNSIMFPTIFSLACEKLGTRAADGSGLLNIAIFGGAIIPLMTGAITDVTGSLSIGLALPALCYAIIAAYGIYARKPAT